MNDIRKVSIRVGLMTVVSLVLFVISLAFISRWHAGATGFELHVKFSFLNNLSVGAPVRVAGGINIGYVKAIYQKDIQTYAHLYLDDSLRNKIPKKPETQFAIFTQGLMGQKYINIVIPASQEGDEFYQHGDEAIGIDPPSIDQMLLAFSSWFDGKSGGQVLAQIIQETKLFIGSLNSIIAENRQDIRSTISRAKSSLVDISAQLNSLMGKLNVLTESFVDISKQNKEDIQIMLQNISFISKDMNEITKRINSGRGSLGKLIKNDELYSNLLQASESANNLLYQLKKQPWRIWFKE